MNVPEYFINTQEVFGLAVNFQVPAFLQAAEHVPELDENYCFEDSVTTAILSGFANNRRVFVQGLHGSGKSSHIEQVAARLNWPCMRINLDGHVSRMDLIGKDAIVLEQGQQVTQFIPGILTWAIQRPMALVLDEYDAGRPDVMFVIQRLLEAEGKLTLLEQACVIAPHPAFRLFATANTVGMGDASGLYVGTNTINQAQLDRWHIIAVLDYLPREQELLILQNRLPQLNDDEGRQLMASMVSFANLLRSAFQQGDVSTLMSLRRMIIWAENYLLLKDLEQAFRYSFLNICDSAEYYLISEYYQRCFARELSAVTDQD